MNNCWGEVTEISAGFYPLLLNPYRRDGIRIRLKRVSVDMQGTFVVVSALICALSAIICTSVLILAAVGALAVALTITCMIVGGVAGTVVFVVSLCICFVSAMATVTGLGGMLPLCN